MSKLAEKGQVAELAWLIPERAEAIHALSEAGKLSAEDAESLLAEARMVEARPRIEVTQTESERRTHALDRASRSYRAQFTPAQLEIMNKQALLDAGYRRPMPAEREDPIEAYDRRTIWGRR
jgi:hypothetical protein